jgi:hypothetical protein
MICFRDTTFCSHETHDANCDRRWTPELSAAAERWWGGLGAPVAFGPMCSGVPTPESTDDR